MNFQNIIGPEQSLELIQEYLQKRGYLEPSPSGSTTSNSAALKPYIKPPASDPNPPSTFSSHKEPHPPKIKLQGIKKKKDKKVAAVSLADAARGAVVFKQGTPCSCQARRHGLVSNCLGCGKIVCEQEGEGPCSFCGVLVLRDGSAYAGLEAAAPPPSEAEASAEAFTKRLVDYDRNSAARTSVIDDQSDYYEFESNSWLSKQVLGLIPRSPSTEKTPDSLGLWQEKEVLARKLKEKEEEEEQRRKKVVVTFDLLGRKVIERESPHATALSLSLSLFQLARRF